MTRTEFIEAYAKRSEVAPEGASLGFLRVPGESINNSLIAMPCACDSEKCEGWGMISSMMQLDHHMRFHAPEELSKAYCKYADGDSKIWQEERKKRQRA